MIIIIISEIYLRFGHQHFHIIIVAVGHVSLNIELQPRDFKVFKVGVILWPNRDCAVLVISIISDRDVLRAFVSDCRPTSGKTRCTLNRQKHRNQLKQREHHDDARILKSGLLRRVSSYQIISKMH